MESDLIFPEYDSLDITTQTFVIYSNLNVDILSLYDHLKCVPLKYPIKAHKRMIVHEEEDLKDGDIVYVEYLGKFKGFNFRSGKDKQMRNCMTIIMKIGPIPERNVPTKYYNIKLSKKGNFQITGCMNDAPVKEVLKYLWKILFSAPKTWSFQPEFKREDFLAYITCRMCNVKFALPFQINLRDLNYFVKTTVGRTARMIDGEVEYSSTHEPSVGYVGVNIKIRSAVELISDAQVIRVSQKGNELVHSETHFSEYLDYLSPEERNKKTDKKYQNSFLVFHSGKTIMSGKISKENRLHSYREFCNIIKEFKHHFQTINET